jgi:hypothetical protein
MPERSTRQQELQLTHTRKASGPSASNKLATSSAKACAVTQAKFKEARFTAAKMLDFVREMSLGNEEFSQRQADYWIFILQDYAPPMIEQAFHKWVKHSKHMPVPSEIVAILDGMMEKERQESVTKQTEEYVSELRETRRRLAEAGELSGDGQYHELMKRALEAAKKIPALPDPNRRLVFKERLARIQAERMTKRKPAAQAVVGQTRRQQNMSA